MDLSKINYNNIEFHNIKSWNFLDLCNYNLKIFVDGFEIPKLRYIKKSIEFQKHKNFYVQGKYFLFILLNKKLGLKILYNKIDTHTKDKEQKSLEKVIKIQKLLYKKNIAFNCGKKPIEINIKHKKLNETQKFYYYLTETDIINEEIERAYLQKIILKEYPYFMNIIYNELNINRSRLKEELKKTSNYILTPKKELKLIDIDPKFYLENNERKT